MDEEEIERLIADLRAMMIDTGFFWAVEQAEEGLGPDQGLVDLAKALVEAAAGVTVDLADMEIRTVESLQVDEVHFKADDIGDGGELEPATMAPDARVVAVEQPDAPRGQLRTAMLRNLAAQRRVFDELRRLLNGVSK